ncbi:hypothetical protein BKA61DRAFT_716055 [Leptodontidium sp. MPI-SDFR-AT-0119]|nr:hypothetical protein BKA61DRAFT_716055 [Leptodontidium sp. MPI-SDFR-AT-0119]
MKTTTFLAAIAPFAPFTHGYLEDPPTTAAPDTVQDCSYWDIATSRSTCADFATIWAISLADFVTYNPSVGTSCQLTVGNSYCVERNFGNPPVATSTSTSAKPTSTTSAGNGVSTPSPIQAGMTTNCNSFYLTKSGDDCAGILSKFGVSLAQFYAWNPAVGSTCTGLWLDTYVCVGAIGFVTSTVTKTTTSAVVTTTAAGNGISTPTPIQTGMATNCNTFYLVKANDECGTIASSKGISLANFYSWNPAVGSSCGSLWLDTYVCVNVIGGTTIVSTPTSTQKPTTTSAGNGIATPTPIQAGMVTNCRTFHLVVSNDECGTIATKAGITLANFYTYNPGVGSSCGSLWLGYYVCIGL